MAGMGAVTLLPAFRMSEIMMNRPFVYLMNKR
jgi:hypothetical protein